jgi:hypothetical protein
MRKCPGGLRALRRIIKAERIRSISRANDGRKTSEMGSINVPFAASGPRSPTKRPRGIPPAVRAALLKLVWDEEECDLVVAARASGLQPDTLRRWLNRSEVVGFVIRERAAKRLALCARNETVLAQIRDRGGNEMARVNAVKALEQLDEQAPSSRAANLPTPGVTIRIINVSSPPAPIDIVPKPAQIIDAGDSD